MDSQHDELLRLQAVERARNEFLTILAHELRHPLAPIRNAARVLQIAPPGSSDAAAAVAIIERQVVQLARLVDDLLDVARITSNRLELRREAVDIRDLVRHAAEASALQIRERGLEFDVVDGSPESIRVDADPARLAQVLSNLLDNACKFTPAPGRIELSYGRRDAEAWITVRDTGRGIAADALPRVFDLFVQGEAERDRAGPGLGIGLALVRRLVEMHGGSVSVQSEGPGRGCTFEIRLPVAAR